MEVAVLFFIVLFVLFQSGFPHNPEEEEERRLFKPCLPLYCANTEMNQPPIRGIERPEGCEPFEQSCSEGSNEAIYVVRVGDKLYTRRSILNISLDFMTNQSFQRDLNSSLCETFNPMNPDSVSYLSPHMPSAQQNLVNCSCSNNWSSYYIDSNASSSLSCHPIKSPDYEILFGLLTAALSFKEHKGGKHIKRKVVIVLGVVAAVIFCLLSVIFIWYRHRRNSALAKASSDLSSISERQLSDICFEVPIFSHRELEEATDNFDSAKALGHGGFGAVYYGKLRDGREVAVKRLYERKYGRLEQFMNEIVILTRLRHRNLLELYGCSSRRSRQLLLVYEYIPNGTVADHLHGNQAKSASASMSWSTRMRIAIETASALAYLHDSDVVHRDVKTDNILLDTQFRVKVADFGISKLFPTDVTHVSTVPQGTPGYIDPEYYQCYQLTNKSDVYSFGVVLIELISAMPAVDLTRHRHEISLANLALNKIRNCEIEDLIDSSLGHRADKEVERKITLVSELAFSCLQHDKELRPCMSEVLEELERIERGECLGESRSKTIGLSRNIEKALSLPGYYESNSPPRADSMYKWSH